MTTTTITNEEEKKLQVKKIGDYLHKQRLLNGYKLVDVAQALGTSQPYISNIENGKNGSRLNLFVAGKLAKLYGITIDSIYCNSLIDDNHTSKNSDNVISVDGLDDDEIQNVKNIINSLKLAKL